MTPSCASGAPWARRGLGARSEGGTNSSARDNRAVDVGTGATHERRRQLRIWPYLLRTWVSRYGPHRELKKSLENYWAGKTSAGELEAVAAGLRQRSWRLQASLGIDHVPSGDFSLYDHVLDTAVLVGAVPERYEHGPGAGPVGALFRHDPGRDAQLVAA